MSNNTTTKKSFVESFNEVNSNLIIRYNINMHLDFIQEFIKFADNTRDIDLLNLICGEIQTAEIAILTHIKSFENEREHKENID